MAVEHWTKHPDGNIALQPLTGWECQVAPLTALLRLESVRSEAELQRGAVQALQLAMTAPQCRSLAAALLKMAAAIEAQPRGTRQ